MPVIKKIKFDLGEGEEIIKISLDSKGVFSADLPQKVFNALHKSANGYLTLDDCLKEANNLLFEYVQLQKTEKWIILIRFKNERIEQFAEGLKMELKYIALKKVQFGKKITYNLLHQDVFDGKKWKPLMNEVNMYNYEGSIELDFSEETYNTIELLHTKLKDLSGKLTDMCQSKELLLSLTSNLLGIASGNKEN